MSRHTRPTTGTPHTTPPQPTPEPEAGPAADAAAAPAPPRTDTIRLDHEPLAATRVAGSHDLPPDDPEDADPDTPSTRRGTHRAKRKQARGRHARPLGNAQKPSARHRKPATTSRTVRRAQAIGLPTLGLPAIILLLIFTVGPSDGDSTATTTTAPPTAATSYPMPSLNPNGLPAGYATAGTNGQIPTGALASAAADPGTTPDLVTLAAAERQIPAPVLAAYQQAATTLTGEQPGCHLRWQLLAGIGKVESGNATGRQISADGTVTPTILGPRLTGGGGFARILDTDHGTLDNDTSYDRAVGPLQFLPGTWKGAGRDGNSDGRKNPNNIHDAALATGDYLCAHHRDLTDPAQLNAAIRAYNPSDTYVRAVLAWTTGYTATEPTPIPAAPAADPPTSPSTPDQTFPIFELTPNQTTPASTPTPTCPTITLTASSLTATLTATTLDLTGRYIPAVGSDPDGVVSLHTTARTPTGEVLVESDRALPAAPGDLPVLLTQLPVDKLTAPGRTSTIALTLTMSAPDCPARALTTLSITNITLATTTPTPTPASTSTPTSTTEGTYPIFELTPDQTTPSAPSPSPSPTPSPTP